ncbi:PucR family transcriptional regulator [Phytoactinopolyspora halophila]|uniref:PucR family transcriptional regulator n=1 Tax=Phytoactinopolyspora halophila TaxID=1981511 RepID=UPI001314FD20|nr:PucR family transcriptional regulator [Phytoactinopolyspora halophila]
MELTLQQLLDAVAERIGRPAVLEDRFLKLIAYSAHDRPLDEVREDSILRKHASTEVSRWLKEFGLAEARRPLRLPANPELHMLPRVCIPVLYKDRVLGYLWFVDSDSTMTTDEIDVCVAEAEELGEQLHRESVASLFATARLADTMHMLLSDSAMTAEAATSLEEAGYLTAGDGIVALVLQGIAHDGSTDVDIEDPLAQAMADFRRLVRRGQALDLVSRDHCVVVMSCTSDDDPHLHERVNTAVAMAQSSLAASPSPVSLVAGIGSRRTRLEDAVHSFREARMSVDAALQLPGVGDIVYWSHLGVHQIVVKLAALGEQVPVVHRGLGRLLGDPDTLPLLETLETYLDVAGNAQVTAERLNLHRTSLYYRLQRLEQLAHTDLKNGVERLSLHLALKVARMTGQYAPRHGGERTGRTNAHDAGPGLPSESRNDNPGPYVTVPAHARH